MVSFKIYGNFGRMEDDPSSTEMAKERYTKLLKLTKQQFKLSYKLNDSQSITNDSLEREL